MISPVDQFVILLAAESADSTKMVQSLARRFCKEHSCSFFGNDLLLKSYHKLVLNETIKPDRQLERIFTLKSTRSDSGIVVVSVLTKPYACPGKCLYCPSEPGIPKSYLAQEPAVMRALLCKYHPCRQVEMRLQALANVGHIVNKISIRIIGGTWSYYPKRYQGWFVRELFKAANNSSSKGPHFASGVYPVLDTGRGKQVASSEDLEKLQEDNETARHRIVELSVETRPDYVDLKEIKRLRQLGITKVELGVQSVDDAVLSLNRRGHGKDATIKATKLLKDAGFKVSYQVMVNLPGSSQEKDIAMFDELFHTSSYQPDHLKIYPLALLEQTGAYKMFQEGKFKPYNVAILTSILKSAKKQVPFYCRIERVIRDIPAGVIVESGAQVSDLRQRVLNELESEGYHCRCIRCREVKKGFLESDKIKLFREDYEASGGHEIFLSYETADRKKLLSLLRLRVPSSGRNILPALKTAVLIRELHTYGPQVKIGGRSSYAAQHRGFGKKLVKEAERIALEEFRIKKIAVIAGVGVRPYFRKLGYELNQTYMIKILN